MSYSADWRYYRGLRCQQQSNPEAAIVELTESLLAQLTVVPPASTSSYCLPSPKELDALYLKVASAQTIAELAQAIAELTNFASQSPNELDLKVVFAKATGY